MVVLNDGSSFIMYGTDLGNWIVDYHDSNGFFPTLNSLINIINEDNYRVDVNYNIPFPVIIIDDYLAVENPLNDKIYKIKLNNLSNEELVIVKDNTGQKVLSHAIGASLFWRAFFY